MPKYYSTTIIEKKNYFAKKEGVFLYTYYISIKTEDNTHREHVWQSIDIGTYLSIITIYRS